MEISLLIGIPFVTFLILLISGKRISGLAGIIGCVATLTGFILSLVIPGREVALEIPWITAAGFNIDISLNADLLASIMLPLVHGIALLVQCYSISYMKGDAGITRYFAFIQLFLFSMIGIVVGGNLIVVYIFWELVGLSSYLLIGFWNQKPRTVWAAQKAFIMNRIGDAAFLSGILLLIYTTGTVRFDGLPAAISQVDPGMQTLIGLLLFGGCIGKSAQFPLSGWLPDAMEGPTPASALIHAATMVAAGIFLMARVGFLLSPHAELVITVIGIITMADGAIRACSAWDIKRVLAYSTQSQLGLMVVAVGIGAWQIALFHLVTHAFFKAGLFLSAGSVIHAVTPAQPAETAFNPQDMRAMGGLRQALPITFACYLICAAALAGLPLFSGFLSKDAIFLAAVEKASHWGALAYIVLGIAMLSAGLTAYYMTRQLWLIFFGNPRYPKEVHPHESGALMWVPMAILSFLSFFFSFSRNPIDGSSGWLLRSFNLPAGSHSLAIPALSAILSFAAIFIAIKKAQSAGGFFISGRPAQAPRFRKVEILRDYQEEKQAFTFFLAPFQFLAITMKHIESYLVDALVNAAGKLMIGVSRLISRTDRYVVDGAVRLIAGTAYRAGSLVKMLQSGKIQSYYLVTFVSLMLLVIWLMAGN